MEGPRRRDVVEIFREGTAVDRALRKAVREALLRHKLLGQSVVVWRDGKVVRVPPEEIVVGPGPRRRSARPASRPARKSPRRRPPRSGS
jgi:hypothetical protein